MTALEREIDAKLQQMIEIVTGPRPAARYEDYLVAHARMSVLRELKDFIADRKARSETPGDIDDDE